MHSGARKPAAMPALAGLLAACLSALCLAQTYPERPIRFITGPGPDTLARVIGQKLEQAMGQPVVVDQRGGGGGSISGEAVAARRPMVTPCCWPPAPTPSTRFSTSFPTTSKDFIPVCLVAAMPFVLSVNPQLPVRSVAELVGYAKARPGQLNFGSGGNASPPQLAGEWFKSAAGIDTSTCRIRPPQRPSPT